MAEYSGKVVVVTGAGLGFGRSIALAFARQGANLALNDLTPVNLNETIAQAVALGAQCKDYLFDLAKKMPVEALINEILRDWGRIDILVNSAGVHPHIPLLEMDEWDLRRTLDVNLFGPFFTIQLAGRIMRQQGAGVIINLAASPGSNPGLQDSSAFLASKVGLIGLTRAAASELAADNIRLYAVCPDWADLEHKPGTNVPPQLSQAGWEKDQFARLDQFEKIAGLVLTICRKSAGYPTGQVITWDGKPAT